MQRRVSNSNHQSPPYALTFPVHVVSYNSAIASRLGQNSEVHIIQLAYKNTLDEVLLWVHDLLREGSLKLENGFLPQSVLAKFNAYRSKHTFKDMNNDDDIACRIAKLNAMQSYELHARQAIEKGMPMSCKFRQCTLCGFRDVKNTVYSFTFQADMVSWPRHLRICEVYPVGKDADRVYTPPVKVAIPEQAKTGDVVTFQLSRPPQESQSAYSVRFNKKAKGEGSSSGVKKSDER